MSRTRIPVIDGMIAATLGYLAELIHAAALACFQSYDLWPVGCS